MSDELSSVDRAIVRQALEAWGYDGARFKLVAQRENKVFKLDLPDGSRRALRLHRQNFRSDAQLKSELAWKLALKQGGLAVPEPLASHDGNLLKTIDGVQVDVLTWLQGRPMGQTGEPLAAWVTQDHFYALGKALANLHKVSDAWTPPAGFERLSWDQAGLLGDDPTWGRFWQNPALSARQSSQLLNFRETALETLAKAETLDFGLIHADGVRENVMIDGDSIQLIDFDDGGWGYRLFEIATVLRPNEIEPLYEALKKALIAGYSSVRAIDLTLLPLFEAIRAVTYLGWIAPRMTEPGAQGRLERFLRGASNKMGLLL